MELRELADNLGLYQLFKGQSVERAIPSIVMAACGDQSPGLTQADVEEIVRAEIADSPPPPIVEPEMTSAEVEQAIRQAIAERPQPEPGLTRAEVESIVRQGIESITESKNELTSADAERIVRAVPQARAAPTAETMHREESRP